MKERKEHLMSRNQCRWGLLQYAKHLSVQQFGCELLFRKQCLALIIQFHRKGSTGKLFTISQRLYDLYVLSLPVPEN